MKEENEETDKLILKELKNITKEIYTLNETIRILTNVLRHKS